MLIAPKGAAEPSWKSGFSRFAALVSHTVGNALTFAAAVIVVLVWALTGPLFHFSDSWQLVINTGTTIITFLMVFVIQHTQNRDSTALQLKLDEVIRALSGAHNSLIDLERLTDAELMEIHRQYERLASEAARRLREGRPDTDSPEVPKDRELR